MNLKTNLLFILLLLLSVAAQCIFGNFPFAFFAFPLDAILALLWIALIGYGYKEKRHSEAVRLWLSPQCTCWTLGWFLVGCLVIGKRLGYGREAMSPHNLTFTMIGACVLWIGWFGFNGGSGLAANERAVLAILVSQIAAAAAGCSWMACEWILRGKPSLLGMVSGAVAGLVVITPASGFVEPLPALLMGLLGGVVCFWGATGLKRRMGWDDSLDAFGVHGVGGILGAILTGVFASSAVTGAATLPVLEQVGIQAASVAATLVYGGLASFVLFKLVDLLFGLRVDTEAERQGLDLALHGERVE